MIVSPDSNIHIAPPLESFQTKADRTMMRTAIILERESKDLAPVAALGVPALALLTFYGKNDAFIPNVADKRFIKNLKSACNKTSNMAYDASGKGIKAGLYTCWRCFEWTKNQAKQTFKELREISSPQLKRFGNALADDAKSVLKRTV